MTQYAISLPRKSNFIIKKQIIKKGGLAAIMAVLFSVHICSFAAKNDLSTPTDTIEIHNSLKQARKIIHFSYDSALNIALRTLDKAKTLQYKKGISDANEVLGYIYSQSEKWHTPKESELLAKQISWQLNNNRTLSKVLIDIAEDYYRFTFKKHAAQAMENSANIARLENNRENRIYFEKIHPNFFEKLKTDFPDLSINELKFCAYTKMNLNGKEISRLLNINPSSVQISRYRLKKKLGLPEDVNFTDFILQNY